MFCSYFPGLLPLVAVVSAQAGQFTAVEQQSTSASAPALVRRAPAESRVAAATLRMRLGGRAAAPCCRRRPAAAGGVLDPRQSAAGDWHGAERGESNPNVGSNDRLSDDSPTIRDSTEQQQQQRQQRQQQPRWKQQKKNQKKSSAGG